MINCSNLISVEFFPPKTEQGLVHLRQCAETLARYQPQFYSMTFGAGGSSQLQTQQAIECLLQAGITELVPHISCVSTTEQRLREMVNHYLSLGISRFVVLRGDLPPEGDEAFVEWNHASDLVRFMRQEWGEQLHLSVACYPEAHPESDHLLSGLDFFLQKMHAGADQAITQFFYNAESYRRFVARCRRQGLESPIIPGIMPLDNFSGIKRFAGRCGAEIPRWLEKEMLAYENDKQAVFDIGVEVVTALCARLLDLGAPGLHFYTLNRSAAVIAILHQLQRQGYVSLVAQTELENV
jgi:methylenetetrahydrofolate reductase (NADPH)